MPGSRFGVKRGNEQMQIVKVIRGSKSIDLSEGQSQGKQIELPGQNLMFQLFLVQDRLLLPDGPGPLHMSVQQ